MADEFEVTEAERAVTGHRVMTGRDVLHERSRWHLTQGGLACVLGVHKMSVSKWERGERAIPAGQLAWLLVLRDSPLTSRQRLGLLHHVELHADRIEFWRSLFVEEHLTRGEDPNSPWC